MYEAFIQIICFGNLNMNSIRGELDLSMMHMYAKHIIESPVILKNVLLHMKWCICHVVADTPFPIQVDDYTCLVANMFSSKP